MVSIISLKPTARRQQYFVDKSFEYACPPLKVLLEILANGTWNGKDQSDPEVRAMFQRDAIVNSEWYKQRLQSKQAVDSKLLQRHIFYLTSIVSEARMRP